MLAGRRLQEFGFGELGFRVQGLRFSVQLLGGFDNFMLRSGLAFEGLWVDVCNGVVVCQSLWLYPGSSL